MTRNDRVAELLWSLAGPGGPLRPEDEDERQRSELIAGDPASAAMSLLNVLRSREPPPGVAPADVAMETAMLLSELARDPGVVELLLAALEAPTTRIAALDALALSGERSAVPALVALAQSDALRGWSESDLVSLASALGSMDTPEAQLALEALGARWPSAALDHELAKFKEP